MYIHDTWMRGDWQEAKSPPRGRVRVRERDGRRSVGIAICRDNIWMGVASYYSEKSSLCTRREEDPELCKASLSFSLCFIPYSSRAWSTRRKKSGNWSQFRWRNLEWKSSLYRLSIPMAHTTPVPSVHAIISLVYLHWSFCELLVCDNIDYRFQWHTPRSTLYGTYFHSIGA